jgi:hypothetical protein
MTDTISTKLNVRWECIASRRTGALRPSDLSNATNRARYSARSGCREAIECVNTTWYLHSHVAWFR